MKNILRLKPTTVVLALFCAMYFLTYIDRVNVSSAAAGFGTEFNLSKTQIGFVFSAFAYPYLIFQIIGGWVSDRFGAKRTLIYSGLIWALATILTGFAGGLVSLVAARVLLGLGEGATFPAATSAMARWIPKENRGFAQGITHAFARVGNAVAPALIVFILVEYGWRWSFYASGLLSLVWVILWALFFTENPADHPLITPEELAKKPAPRKIQKTPWKRLAKRMAPVTVVYFCYGWTLWLFLSWIPQYFLHSYNLKISTSALFASSVFFAGVVGDTLGGIISDKILRKTNNLNVARSWMVAICMTCTLLSLLPIMFTHDITISVLSLSFGFFFAEMTIGPMWAIPMDIAPEFSGTASGMMNTGSALAAIISPVVSGFLIDCYGSWELPFVGSIILMAGGVLLTSRMKPNDRFTA
ncbi:MFS transporter [Polynucleobacter sphagniphilus]|jgi:MFS family permease|uniref:MFS family permease n=1 Tax=Polynucleobacter sphagniphilus TaxID=1743169 RepID=A0AA43S5I6_9BURK|nr:MFS transporter [Polynucleobacter sphagniphilus]MDH6300904.1 MFS family permease [Polynucleobacter sphagniphilus]MDH6504385.1 MFS family permease [Polynucleobacter sphagniphilus]MDH6512894.1 MFS family permease [Polynucleobacter sphagniphilus]